MDTGTTASQKGPNDLALTGQKCLNNTSATTPARIDKDPIVRVHHVHTLER